MQSENLGSGPAGGHSGNGSLAFMERSVDRRLARWSWGLLWLTVAVIVGGSLVRATGSGDGCGDSWPRCQGSLFPLGGGVETSIEFAHRAATAVLGVALVAFVLAVWRSGTGSHLRRALKWVGVFFIGEVLIGAVLVLAGWVDQDASVGRAIAVPLHLVNTFLLLAAVVVVVHIANGGRWPQLDRSRRSHRIGVGVLLALLVVASSGALNALADTLFPADTLLEGIRAEFGAAAPFLVRLRVLHPMLAIAGAFVAIVGLRSESFDRRGSVRGLANIVAGVVGVEVVVGLVNVALLTPVEIQLIHLLIADVLWIVAVLAVVRVIAESSDVAALEPA